MRECNLVSKARQRLVCSRFSGLQSLRRVDRGSHTARPIDPRRRYECDGRGRTHRLLCRHPLAKRQSKRLARLKAIRPLRSRVREHREAFCYCRPLPVNRHIKPLAAGAKNPTRQSPSKPNRTPRGCQARKPSAAAKSHRILEVVSLKRPGCDHPC